jgi:hypothetical protein
LVNSVLTSLPTFYICSIKVPIDILNQIDKYRKHYLWNGGDVNAKKSPLAAWKMVTKPKSKGGLGVIRLRLQNDALVLKIFINSLTWLICLGFNCCGLNIIAMVKFLDRNQRVLIGGEAF